MKPLIYSLQFRGQAYEAAGGRLARQGRAPSCALVTTMTARGLEACFVWSPDAAEALLESSVELGRDGSIVEEGTVHIAPGHALHVRGRGSLVPSPDPSLRHGVVVWEVVGGTGQFDGASGLIASNVLLSDTGDVTESHLGVLFPTGTPQVQLDQGSPRRDGEDPCETLRSTQRRTRRRQR